MEFLSALLAGGARIVELRVPDDASPQLQQVPAVLAGLTQLQTLSFAYQPIQNCWQHLPRQLQSLELDRCGLQQLPAALAGLTQLTRLSLESFDDSPITAGWQHMPQQLKHLRLVTCGLQEVPAALAGLTQLTALLIESNYLEGSCCSN